MKKTVFTVLLVLLVCFIFGNSVVPRENSAETSSAFVELLTPVLVPIVGEGNITQHFVRKLAHFAEYSALGFVLYGNIALRGKKSCWFVALNIGFLIAFADETIQIFSGRGPQIQDVWLDISGVGAGILFALLCSRIIWKKLFYVPDYIQV